VPFQPVPPLPSFIAQQLPMARGSYELEHGPNAGRDLHYIDTGPSEGPKKGEPTVFMVHGNPTWSFLWRKVIAALPGRRCVAPDLLGFGLSSRLPREEDHRVERHADTLCELVDALELDRVVLVGQDWGGPLVASLGARLSAQRSDRVAGVVLGNTSVLVPREPRGTLFHRFARAPVVSDLAFKVLGMPQNLLWVAQGDRRSIRGDVARAYRWPLRSRQDRVGPLALARMVPDSVAHPAIDELRRGEAWIRAFEGPMALVWGTKDPILGKALRRHEETFPDAPVTLTRAGHFLQEEVPDALAAAIEDVSRRARAVAAETHANDQE
jgi:cis-3-alkyl-4-acyloxetan-2-one decarboxylase